VLDIGANIGLFSIAAKKSFPQATIHAYEPNPAAQECLRLHSGQVGFEYFMEAVGKDEGRMRLALGGSSLVTRARNDENGAVAFTGNVCEALLTSLFQHPFFHKAAPKSTGREEFGDVFIDRMLKIANQYQLKSEDVVATATELTARSIAEALKFSRLPFEQIDELIMSGGGVHNKALVNSLKKYFHHSKARTTDEFDLPGDAKEAICFAVLANETIAGNPANLPSVTGAKRATILGSICLV
jgi:anhydro-N-acetylmuramic acid kinase